MIWSRWSGAGNTFFIADVWTQKINLNTTERSQLAVKLCQQFPKAQTDGLLILEPKESFDFSWDFYNSDGSSAEMCGNAARCASRYFAEKIKSVTKMRFLTLAGEIESEILSSHQVQVRMPRLAPKWDEVQGLFYINTGVPHLVLQETASAVRAKSLRPLPSGAGSNVTFVSEISKQGCKAVTFERGVEDFTAACGTGAVAAGAFLTQKYGPGKYRIEMPGGVLEIENASLAEKPLLRGPAEWSFDLEQDLR